MDQRQPRAVAYVWSPIRQGEPHKQEINAQLESIRKWALTFHIDIAAEFIEVTGSTPTYRPKLQQAIDTAKELQCILAVYNYSIFGKFLPQSTLWERKTIDAKIPVYFSEGGYLDPDMVEIREGLARKETYRRSESVKDMLSDPATKERVVGTAVRARQAKRKAGKS